MEAKIPPPPMQRRDRGSLGSQGHCRGRHPHQFSHGRSTALPGGWRRPPWVQGQSRVGTHMLFWNQKPSTAFWFPARSAHAPPKQSSAPTWQAPTLKCHGYSFQTPISSQFPALGKLDDLQTKLCALLVGMQNSCGHYRWYSMVISQKNGNQNYHIFQQSHSWVYTQKM